MEIPELGLYNSFSTLPMVKKRIVSKGNLCYILPIVLKMLNAAKGHAVVAGGFALYNFRKSSPKHGTRPINNWSDVDIYLYGDAPLEETLSKMLEHVNITRCLRTNHYLELEVYNDEHFILQIILINYKSIKSLLKSFDLGCCQVAFDNDNWYMTGYFKWSLKTMYNIDFYGTEIRYYKYINRDFKILNFTEAVVDESSYENKKYVRSLHQRILEFLKTGTGVVVLMTNTWQATDMTQCDRGLYTILNALWAYLDIPQNDADFGPLEGAKAFYKLILETLSISPNPEHNQIAKRLNEYRMPLRYYQGILGYTPVPGETTFKPVWSRKYYALYPEFIDLGMYLLAHGWCLDLIKHVFRMTTLLRIEGIEELWNLVNGA